MARQYETSTFDDQLAGLGEILGWRFSFANCLRPNGSCRKSSQVRCILHLDVLLADGLCIAELAHITNTWSHGMQSLHQREHVQSRIGRVPLVPRVIHGAVVTRPPNRDVGQFPLKQWV